LQQFIHQPGARRHQFISGSALLEQFLKPGIALFEQSAKWR
jgi:hypothetical protein